MRTLGARWRMRRDGGGGGQGGGGADGGLLPRLPGPPPVHLARPRALQEPGAAPSSTFRASRAQCYAPRCVGTQLRPLPFDCAGLLPCNHALGARPLTLCTPACPAGGLCGFSTLQPCHICWWEQSCNGCRTGVCACAGAGVVQEVAAGGGVGRGGDLRGPPRGRHRRPLCRPPPQVHPLQAHPGEPPAPPGYRLGRRRREGSTRRSIDDAPCFELQSRRQRNYGGAARILLGSSQRRSHCRSISPSFDEAWRWSEAGRGGCRSWTR